MPENPLIHNGPFLRVPHTTYWLIHLCNKSRQQSASKDLTPHSLAVFIKDGGGGGSRNHLPEILQLPNIQSLTDLQNFANFCIVTSSSTERQILAPKLILLWYVIHFTDPTSFREFERASLNSSIHFCDELCSEPLILIVIVKEYTIPRYDISIYLQKPRLRVGNLRCAVFVITQNILFSR